MMAAMTAAHEGPLFISPSIAYPDGARIEFGPTWIALNREECDALILGLTAHLSMLDQAAAAERIVIEVAPDA